MAEDILLVEDDEQVRRALSRTLVAQGYTVATANNGKDSLAHLGRSSDSPKVIIMDLLMPVMDGWVFRRELLAQPRWADVPVIVLSGSGCDDSGGALPAVHYVQKPVSLALLFEQIARFVSKPPLE